MSMFDPYFHRPSLCKLAKNNIFAQIFSLGHATLHLDVSVHDIFSRVLRYSSPLYVRPSVGQSIGWSPFWAAAPEGPMTYDSTQGDPFLGSGPEGDEVL